MGCKSVNLRNRRAAIMAQDEGYPYQPLNENLIDTIRSGYIVNTTDGTLTSNSSGRYSDYIPVYPGRSYQCRKYSNRPGYLARYDKDKNFISGANVSNSTQTYGVYPSAANGYRYIRWSGTSGSGGPLSVTRTV